MAGVENNYNIILNSLKEKINQARQKAALAVNKELLLVYWEIGNTISLQQKSEGWGTKVIDRLAADLKTEFPDFKGLSVRNLKYMKAFAEAYPDFIIVQPVVAQLQEHQNQQSIFVQPAVAQIPWAHHIVLLNKVPSKQLREFYIKKTAENGWSKSVLAVQIESQLHLRQGNAITNFDLTLPKPHSDLAKESIKNPYIFDFLAMGEKMQERELENALIQHIKKFMLEIGRGFAYVGNQYNLKVEDDDFYLDLLFFNYHLDCFVVFELKVGEFEPEFAGKLNFYINTIDAKVKLPRHKPTIGVLLCKTPNETVVQYALKGIETPMGVAEYEFTNALPKQLKGEMPTIEELEQEIEKESIEFKEHLNPVDARLQAIKEKLRGIKTEEIQTQVTYPILVQLYKEGLRPLFEEIIQKFLTFNEEFKVAAFSWRIGNSKTDTLTKLDSFFTDAENVMERKDIEFQYNLSAFKKAGTENFGEHLILKFEWHEYWYGFTLINHNNQQPFIKKLYHQPITKEDQQQVIDLMMTQVMDRIEWILEFMKNKNEKNA